ncbi:P-loop containing nucleoside triphosphate hydrolase [Phytophthora cactorum]|nr:P-loop containing nucleoside triphosphate hydrolase [Phytophthora cactorum]
MRPVTKVNKQGGQWDDALLSEIEALESRHLQTRSHQNQIQNQPTPLQLRIVYAAERGVESELSSVFHTSSAFLWRDGCACGGAAVAAAEAAGRRAGRWTLRAVAIYVEDREQPSRSSQTTLSSAATGSGLVLTSRRSGQVTGAATTKRPVHHPYKCLDRQQEKTHRPKRVSGHCGSSNFPQIDYEAAQHFVYPTNYSIRDYQLTIAEKALYHNTLVSLPTGLGKTLIVFMAPTKPLVAQQIKAYTAELQGNVPPTMRRVLWNSRRVFFCTPQSLQNDLRRGVCAAENPSGHGNYAYCCVVQEIEAKTHFFRVLALSATPGAKFDVIQDVVTNCIMEIKTQFLKFFTPIIQRLLRISIIQNSDPEKLSSWYVLQAREKFRKSPNYASNRSAESDLALLVSLLHAKSLLTAMAHSTPDGNAAVSRVQALEARLAVTDDGNSSTNTNSHPKLVKLRQYRASVSEIVALLRPLAPLLNVQPFIGQGASGKGKENKGVQKISPGRVQCPRATCIAEEGLDIGEVDLIVSFDALTSPVRMIQRMGRTGRKRVGRVIILVTEGDEQKKLARSASAAKTVSALSRVQEQVHVLQVSSHASHWICPQLRELEMKIPTFHASQVGGKATSAAVDPNLWQLSDAERAVALMKYFPPNFASSSRNKLFPIVANRAHLLRRQPRSLVRKGVGARVGYSARSLMLQSLVRKIHGVEEILETESDDEDDKSEANGDKTIAADNAETDSEIGSPWRQPSTPIELDGDSRCDDSFAAMNESVNSFDMHFSPQFVDSATQLAFLEEDSQPKVCSKRRQDDLVTTPRIDDNPLEQTENVELPPPEPPSETQLQSEKHGASPEVQDEEDSAFSFALLPPDPITVQAEAETKEGSGDEDQAEEEASGFSFALLPSLNTGSGVAPIKPRSTATPQLVEDGTDGDEADETCEVKPAGKNELVRSPGTNVTIVDLTEKEDHGPATKHGENEETTPSSKPPNGKKDATQQAVQSQRKRQSKRKKKMDAAPFASRVSHMTMILSSFARL